MVGPKRKIARAMCYNWPMKDVPKYRIVFEKLREDIFAGKYPQETRFPSEEQLVRRFHVSRNTVRTALEDLKRAGIIETRNGSGTYLSPAAANATGTIGLIVPGIATGEIFPRICAEITRVARENGFSTLFGDASSPDPDIRTTQVLRLAYDYAIKKVNGVILEPLELTPNAEHTTRQVLSILENSHTPIVLLDRDIAEEMHRSNLDLVGIDNLRAGYTLAKHLIGQGARRIHVLIRPDSASTVRRRARGVREALLDSGLTWRQNHLHELDPANDTLVEKAFAKNVDAVVCGNDVTAANLIETLSRIGKKVPKDILVTGVDDIRLSTLISPKLTTLRQPCEEIAKAAVTLLMDRISNPQQPAREILLDTKLIIRKSSVKAPPMRSPSPPPPAAHYC